MKNFYHYFATVAILLAAHLSSYSQNNLAAGDIAFTSYQSDLDATNVTTDLEDRFSVMVLKSGGIEANTVLYFTDWGWSTTTNSFRTSGVEGYIKWVVPAGGLAQGTEVYFVSLYNSVTDITTWNAYASEATTTLVGTVTTEGVNGPLELSTSGDQILVFQTGPAAGPTSTFDNATRRFITAIHANIVINTTTYAGWDGPVPPDLSSSSLPPGLTNGTTAFLMSPGPFTVSNTTTEPDNGKFNCASGNGCTSVELSTNIYSVANWTFSGAAFATGLTSSHCSVASTPLPVINTQPSNVTVCAGEAVSFSATATAAASYQWQESTTSDFASPTTLANTGVYSGTTTNTLLISNSAALNGRYYRMIALNACSMPANSNGVILNATPPQLPSITTSSSHGTTASNYYFGGSCAIIAKVVPSGPSVVNGNILSRVWIEPAVPSTAVGPYVQRHYEIMPETNAATATGTITLYFSQAEFNAFNADAGSLLNLPTGPADDAGKANLRVGKFSGTSSDGTGLPKSYSSVNSLIDPADGNIVWNATTGQWEVTFNVVGFSGFVLQTVLQVLPLNLISFSAQPVSNDITLKWQTANEANHAYSELERSTDGKKFVKISSIAGTNGNSLTSYEWVDAGAALINTGKLYYRLKMVSVSGTVEYSNIIVVSALRVTATIITGVVPNPFKEKLSINLSMPRSGQLLIKLADMTGRVFIQEKITDSQCYSTHDIMGASKLLPGVYLLTAEFEGKKFSYKLVK